LEKFSNELMAGKIEDLFPQLKRTVEIKRLRRIKPSKYLINRLLSETVKVIPEEENFRKTYLRLIDRAFRLGLLKAEDVCFAKLKEK